MTCGEIAGCLGAAAGRAHRRSSFGGPFDRVNAGEWVRDTLAGAVKTGAEG
jgi:hypothetical protein